MVFNGNYFDMFAAKTSVANRKMTGRFQRVKSFDQDSCQITQTPADYSRSLFVQRGSETVSKALVKIPITIKNHMLC